MSNPTPIIQRTSASQIHNLNCWAYLQKLNLSDALLGWLGGVAGDLELQKAPYKPHINYAILYTKLLALVEDHLVDLQTSSKISAEEQQRFILSLYDNDNGVLEQTFQAIDTIPSEATPRDHHTAKKISHQLRDTGKHHIHKKTPSPSDVGSPLGRVRSLLSADYKPQHTTSIATVRHYAYRTNPSTQEYRFGTQGQRHHAQVRVSPLFEAWLKAHKSAHQANDATITHVYINNLPRCRNANSLEFDAGKKESDLTAALEHLEEQHTNVAVITLPADKGLMEKSFFKQTIPSINYDDCSEMFLNIAMERSHLDTPTDFYISPTIRKKLFNGNDETELKALIEASFAELNIKKGALLSPAQQQAIWIYFIKFKLTDYILTTLKPKSVNFTCKDAIDRGGVSSVYYHLMKSIQSGNPITRAEFERALHAAPAMVKGRGMNHQINLLWNAIDVYLNHPAPHTPDWLYHWRDMNCPHQRVDDLLQRRAEEIYNQLDTKSQEEPNNPNLANAKEIIGRTKDLHAKGVSSKRLLLEVIVRTNTLITAPKDTKNSAQYEKLIEKITIKYPMLQLLAGGMKMLIGACLGQHQLKAQGKATALAALTIKDRREIQSYMTKMKHTLFGAPQKTDTPSSPNDTDKPTPQ